MSGDGEDKIIDLPWAARVPGGDGRVPSPSDIRRDPAKYLAGQPRGPEAARPERTDGERPEAPAPAAAPQDDGDNPGGGPESFDPESADYKAFGWAGNKTLPTLRIILKDGSEWPIVYAHLDTHPPDGSRFLPAPPGRKGNLIVLRVAGHDGVFLVHIEGVRLRLVWELLMAHRAPWIHELPPGVDFVARDKPVIWSITYSEATRAAVAEGRG